MGTLTPEAERSLLIGCGGLLLIGPALIVCIGFAIYYTARWVFGI